MVYTMSESSYDSADDSNFEDDIDLDLSILVSKHEDGSLTIKLSVEHTNLSEDERDAILKKILKKNMLLQIEMTLE